MKMCPLLMVVFSCPILFCHVEDAIADTPHLWLADSVEAGVSWAELKEKLPGLNEPRQYISNAPNLTSASDSFILMDVTIPITFQFNDDKLYGWSASLHETDQETAIAIANHLLPKFEDRYGPSTREISLPFEHDGRRDEVSTAYLWKVKEWDASLSLSFRPGSAGFGFGVSRAIMVTGYSYIANPDDPLSGMACRRNQLLPEPVEIVGQAGSMEHLHVLKKLHERGVTGTRPSRAHGLADFGQILDIHGGRFTREDDGKKCLRLSWFRVKFPVTIWRENAAGGRHAEVHFGMDSLFPDGIEFDGKALDLGRFEGWRLPHIQRPARQ